MKSLPIGLSRTEKKIVEILKAYPQVYVSEMAKMIWKGVALDRRPKSINNSVTSAIRQINRKLELTSDPRRIVGASRGSKGKLIYWNAV